MTIVRMPNGKKVRFPDEMPREEIRGFILKKFPDAFSNNVPDLKPLTSEQRDEARKLAGRLRPKKTYSDYLWNNIADIGFGAKKALTGATLGASDWLGRKLGFDVSDDTYLSQRDDEGLGGVARTAGFASELGGNMLGAGGQIVKGLGKLGLKGGLLASLAGGAEGAAYGTTSSDNLSELPWNAIGGGLEGVAGGVLGHGVATLGKGLLRPLSNRLNQYIGKRKLTKQLERGNNFEDINLGNVDDDLVNQVNKIRNAENVSPVDSSKVTIPADRIEHINQGRIIDNGYTPRETAGAIDNALFGRNLHVKNGNLPQYQIIYDSSNPANTAIIGKHKDTGDIFVKTALKDSNLGKKNKTLDGRTFPSYTVDSTVTGNSRVPSPQHVRFSDFQDLNASNITQNIENVNPAFKRSFVEALADENKRRVMKNAVQSGAEDLSERAKILSDQLERRKNGMFDADFEEVIKTPELRKAEFDYSRFMDKNGSRQMAADKVRDFYNQHPVAKNTIAEMRSVDPRAFDGISPGSLAEFDMLKKILREEAGNKIGVGASKAGALKRAENDLKTLMDKEFPGFRDANRSFANAKTTQNIFESKLKKGLSSVGGATNSPFWSGISSPLTAAGLVGGYFNPTALAGTVAGLGGKALMRHSRRNAGRRLADGIVRTPINVNPNLSAGLSATALSNLRKDWE